MFTKLDYVYALYTEKSFTRAAEKLFISQPSLSAAIKGVEEEVGAPLFERCGKSVIPTEIGVEYIEAARKILSVREDFQKRINDIYNLEAGKITVGGTNYLCSYVLPKIINRFSSLHPKVEVELVEEKSQTLHKMMRESEIDVIIDSFEGLGEEYEGYPLLDEKIVLCVPAERPINESLSKYALCPEDIFKNPKVLSDAPTVSVKKFAEEDFVLLKSGNDMYNRATEIFKKAGIEPHVSFSVDQMNISYALADSGIGLCFATDTLFKFGRFKDTVRLYSLKESGHGRHLYIAHKKHKYCTSAMTKFIEIARKITQNI